MRRARTGLARHGMLVASAMVLGTTFGLNGTADAQQGSPPGQFQPSQQRQPSTPTPKQQTKRPPVTDGAPSVANSEAGLRQRVEQLEEQLVDLQVVVGTVESLARSGGSASSAAYRGGMPVSGGGSGADAGRVAALETQVQALTAQLEAMADQMRALQSGVPRGPSGPAPRGGSPMGSQSSGGPPPPPGGVPAGGGFGTTTVVGPSDPIANIINQDQRGAPAQRAAAPMGGSPAGRQQYEAAYSQLLQQNYPAAEAGFAELLQRFPGDELAPNAQFWLGETHFVRGQWDSAAAAFLKVAQSHPRSDKAPDSLAKFAMSMERKGNKPAACRALQELNTRYPNPPAHVKTWEVSERRRAGCS